MNETLVYKIPYETWMQVAEYLDSTSICQIIQTNKFFFNLIQFQISHPKYKYKTYLTNLHECLPTIKNITIFMYLVDTQYVTFDTFQNLILYTEKQLLALDSMKLIKYKKICEEFIPKSTNNTNLLSSISPLMGMMSYMSILNPNMSLTDKIETVGKGIIGKMSSTKGNVEKITLKSKLVTYKIWQRLFNSDSETVELLKKNDGLNFLTEEILKKYRNELIINKKFLIKCFTFELNKSLMIIWNNRKFYNIEIDSELKLEDVYLLLCADMNNTILLQKFVDYIKKEHLVYFIKNGSIDFLKSLKKISGKIENFNLNMIDIKNDLNGKMNRKQELFFKHF